MLQIFVFLGNSNKNVSFFGFLDNSLWSDKSYCTDQDYGRKREVTKSTVTKLLKEASEIYSGCVSLFQSACEGYKLALDRNLGGRFCTDEDCKTVYMVEIRHDGSTWGATPKIFSGKDQAEKEAQRLNEKYHFVSECRVVTRKIHEEKNKIKYLPADYQS